MANNVLQEYLVSLGIKDDFTGKLKQMLGQSSQEVKTFAKGLVMAGSAVTGLFLAANAGIAKFATGLVKSDDEITQYAKDIGKSKDEAAKLKIALDAMGKSMEEIEADRTLHKKFLQLQRDAESMKAPDLTEGLNQVRDIQMEFTRMKQSVTYATQWVGHYLYKYLQQPIQKIKEIFSVLNDSIIKNMPKWTEKVASVMATVVKLGTTVIRGAAMIFTAVKKIFDMIPGNIKTVTGILAALALFIKSGPLGQLLTIFALLMLLAEDFFTYLDGGDALLGGFWQWLIDIWSELNKQGGVIDKLKEAFQNAMDAISRAINNAIEWVKDFWNQLRENGIIDNFREAFKKAWAAIQTVFDMLTGAVKGFIGSVDEVVGGIEPFLVWLISEALPGAIGLIADIAGGIAGVIGWLTQLNGFKEVLITIAGAFALWKTIQLGMIAVQEVHNALMVLSAIKTGGLAAAKTALAAADGSATTAQWLLNAAMSANPIALIIIAVAALIAIVILLVKNWEKVSAFSRELWEKIKAPFVGISEWFAEKFNAAKEKVLGVFNGIGDWFKSNWKSIVLFIINPFAGIFKYLYDNFESFRNFVNSVLTAIKDFFIGLWQKITDGVQAFVVVVINFIAGMINRWVSIVRTIIGFYVGLWRTIISGVQTFIDAVVNFMSGMVERWIRIIGGVVTFFLSIWETVKGDVQTFITAVIAFFIGFIEDAKAIIDKIVGFFSEAWDKAKELAKSFVDGILNIFKPLTDFMSGIGDKIKSIFSGTKTLAVEASLTTSEPSVGHADGIVSTREHIAKVSEDNQPEAIIPLTKPARAKEVLSGAMGYLGGVTGKTANGDNALIQGINKICGILSGIQNIIASSITTISGILANIYVSSQTGDLSGISFQGKIMQLLPSISTRLEVLCETVVNVYNAMQSALRTASTRNTVENCVDQNALQISVIKILSANIVSLAQYAAKIHQSLSLANAMLNQSSSYLYTTNVINNDNRTFDMKSSYHINDVSGRPQAVASAVDRTKQTQLRNLQGILNS